MAKNDLKCVRCPKGFKNKMSLAKHMLSHKPKEEWPIKCQFCAKYFQAKNELASHWVDDPKHKSDPRVPDPSSKEWMVAMERCELYSIADVADILIKDEPISDCEMVDDESFSSNSERAPPAVSISLIKKEFMEDPDQYQPTESGNESSLDGSTFSSLAGADSRTESSLDEGRSRTESSLDKSRIESSLDESACSSLDGGESRGLVFHGFVPGEDFVPGDRSASKRIKLDPVPDSPPGIPGIRIVDKTELTVKLDRIKEFPCSVCKVICITEAELEEHTNTLHRKKPKIYCKVCDRNYFDMESLKAHQARRHGSDKPVTDKVTEKPVSDKQNTDRSLSGKSDTGNNTKSPSTSSQKVKSEKNPNSQLTKDKNNPDKSIQAFNSDKQVTDITLNIKSDTGNKTKSPSTGQKVKTEKTPTSQQKIHKNNPDKSIQSFNMFGPRSFPCKTCKKTFDDKKELARHERQHTGYEMRKESVTKRYRCKICDKVYPDQAALTDHENRRHKPTRKDKSPRENTGDQSRSPKEKNGNQPKSPKENPDTSLGSTSSSKAPSSKGAASKSFDKNTSADNVVLSGNPTFNCRSCTFTSTSISELSKHESSHKSVKKNLHVPYTCKTCSKKFQDPERYRKHKLTHSTFKCQKCEKSFSDKSNLRKHEENHRHNCTNCKATFQDKRSLSNHMTECNGVKEERSDSDIKQEILQMLRDKAKESQSAEGQSDQNKAKNDSTEGQSGKKEAKKRSFGRTK